MKKVTAFILGLALMGSFSSLRAQDVFEKGTNVVQATIGFPQLLGFGPAYTTTIPAIGLVYDRGIVDDLINGNASIGVGGMVGIAGARSSYAWFNGNSGYEYTYVLFGGRGTFHYQFADNFDTYAGVLASVFIANSSEYGPGGPGFESADSGGFLGGAFVGARYYFTDNFAGAAELGYGIALFNVGVAFSF